MYRARLQAVRVRHIDDSQAHAAGIVHGIGRATGGLRQIANTGTAIVYKLPIAFPYTASKIVLRGVSHFSTRSGRVPETLRRPESALRRSQAEAQRGHRPHQRHEVSESCNGGFPEAPEEAGGSSDHLQR